MLKTLSPISGLAILAALLIVTGAAWSQGPLELPKESLDILRRIPAGAKKVLSLEGGGMNGVAAAALLEHIEYKSGKSIAHLFDLIAGTSTGSLLAAVLTVPGTDGKPKYSARDAKEFYFSQGPLIFPEDGVPTGHGNDCFENTFSGRDNKRVPCTYDAAPLKNYLIKTLGHTSLSQAVTKVAIGITVHVNRQFLPVMVSTASTSPYLSWSKGFPMWEAAYISSLLQPAFSPTTVALPLDPSSAPGSFPYDLRATPGRETDQNRYFKPGPYQLFEVIDGAESGLNSPVDWLIKNGSKELDAWNNEPIVVFHIGFSRTRQHQISVDSHHMDRGGTRTVISILIGASDSITDSSHRYLAALLDNMSSLVQSDAFKKVYAGVF